MRFHSQYCSECRTETLFLEKLVDPQDAYCSTMEDKCMKCDTVYEPKPKLKARMLKPNNR